MCGRTACTLDPDNLRRACTYRDRQGRRKQPRWRNNQGGSNAGDVKTNGIHGGGSNQSDSSSGKQRKYFPSLNIAPQAVTPVLVSSKHFDKTSKGDERNLTLMKWGLVPAWHKGDPSSVSFKMNNCRSEGMMEKATFKRPFEKGQRCVVLADGYYEWHTDKAGKKQPYFIYFAEQSPVTTLSLPGGYDFEYKTEDDGEEDTADSAEWDGHRLLTMAGLFDIWKPPDGGDPLYSYSVITIEALGSVSWIHHRMPVFLDGEEAVRDWLDFGSVPSKQALSLIKAQDCLACHPVTQKMGNIRYKTSDCITPVKLEEKKPVANTFMSSWLRKGSSSSSNTSASQVKTEQEDEDDKTEVKKEVEKEIKTEIKKEVKKEVKKTGLTSWLKKANNEETLKRVVDSSSPKKSGSSPRKMPKRELSDADV